MSCLRGRSATAAIVIILTVAACGGVGSSGVSPNASSEAAPSSGSPEASPTGTGQSSLTANLTACSPDAARTYFPGLVDKKLVVGLDATLPPFESTDENDPTKIVGLDPDLIAAVSDCLGLAYELQNMATDALVPALENGRIDLMWSGTFVTPERASRVNFVTYLHADDGVNVAKGNPHNIKTIDDVCGLRASAVTGYAEMPLLVDQSDKCVAAGQKPIDISSYDTEDAAVRAILNKRADFFITDEVSAKNHADQFASQLDFAFSLPSANPFGVGVAKNNDELLNAVHQALRVVQEAGTERELLQKWGFDPSTEIPAEIVGAS